MLDIRHEASSWKSEPRNLHLSAFPVATFFLGLIAYVGFGLLRVSEVTQRSCHVVTFSSCWSVDVLHGTMQRGRDTASSAGPETFVSKPRNTCAAECRWTWRYQSGSLSVL